MVQGGHHTDFAEVVMNYVCIVVRTGRLRGSDRGNSCSSCSTRSSTCDLVPIYGKMHVYLFPEIIRKPLKDLHRNKIGTTKLVETWET